MNNLLVRLIAILVWFVETSCWIPAFANDVLLGDCDECFVVFNSAERYSKAPDGTLVFLMMSDGRVIRNSEALGGSSRYFETQIPAHVATERLKTILPMFEELHALNAKSYTVLDGRHCTMLLRTEGKQLSLGSSHELFETDPRLVATPRGVESKNGASKLEILARQPSNYLLFRLTWSEVRRKAESINSADVRQIEGELKRIDSKLWWIQKKD